MELRVLKFLNIVSSLNTEKDCRSGVKKFYEWFGNNAEEALELRKDDLAQKQGENVKRNTHIHEKNEVR